MGKRLLVSQKLIRDVIRLIIYLELNLDHRDLEGVKHLCSGIEAEIYEKLEKMELRKAFTAYKMATPGPEREALRKDYIELAQIRNSFISNHEIPHCLLK